MESITIAEALKVFDEQPTEVKDGDVKSITIDEAKDKASQ